VLNTFRSVSVQLPHNLPMHSTVQEQKGWIGCISSL